jgi:hypothetical protein
MSRANTDVERLSVERGAGPEPEKSGMDAEGIELELRDPNIVDFDGPDDPDNPLNWSATKKTTAIVIVSLTALLS